MSVKFVRLRGETAILNWIVLLESRPIGGAVGRPAGESVELAAPTVGVRDHEDKANTSE